MNDLSKARELLLQDYIKEFDPSRKEIDAFMYGVTWMMDYVTDDDNLGAYIPDKVCLHRQQRDIEELMEKIDWLQGENKRLVNELRKRDLMTSEERRVWKKEGEAQRLSLLIAELRQTVNKLRAENEKWMNRYLVETVDNKILRNN
ncbi:hypothetical protein [Bacteroides sp.]|jgi:hypothetical protein|uniref:hypothetical protein n=1 Tax=Bacteroides sp. TaxID=29523 RepID=UPI0025BA8B27|nr:hypothetical protein [Bacteroides sp.]